MSDHRSEVGLARALSTPGEELREDPRRILLVEDDEGDALIVVELLLDAWPELKVDRAVDLGDAERRLPGGVDCVVLDLGLPDAFGFDALTRLRETHAEMPVVVLTGDADELRGIEALGAGAQDYLVKGAIDGPLLARAIRHSVQRKLAERFARELAVLRVQTAENARVQRGLVPTPMVEDPRITVRSAYRPGNRRQVLGGDFFDVVQASATCLQVVLGDVCGHGPDEAALGVQLRIAWRSLVLADLPHEDVLRTLDRLMVQERHAEHVFTTVASLRIDLVEGTASVALAGHPSPILVRGGTTSLLLDGTGGPPLGLADPPEWQISEVSLGDSWSLLLYSDGIYEGHVGDGGDRLGIDGLLGLTAAAIDGPAGACDDPAELIDAAEALNQGPLEDDVALLALTCDGRRASCSRSSSPDRWSCCSSPSGSESRPCPTNPRSGIICSGRSSPLAAPLKAWPPPSSTRRPVSAATS
jgi:serine phosphatase RsbU (regulator of sigma subunit)